MLLGLNPLGKYPLGDIGAESSSIPALVVSGAVQITVQANGYAEFTNIPTIGVNGAVEYRPAAYGQVFIEIGTSGAITVRPSISAALAHGVAGTGAAIAAPLINAKALGSVAQGAVVCKPLVSGVLRGILTLQGAVKAAPAVAGSLAHSAGTSSGITGAATVAPLAHGVIGQGRSAAGAVSAQPKVLALLGAGNSLQGSATVPLSARGRAQHSKAYVKPGAARGACRYQPVLSSMIRHGVSISGNARPEPEIRFSRMPPTGSHARVSPAVAGLLLFDSPAVASGAAIYSISATGEGSAGLLPGHLIGNSVPARPNVQGLIHV